MNLKKYRLHSGPFLMMILLLWGASLPVAAQTDIVFEDADCPFAAPDTVECGYLAVPEDWDDPASPEIYLAVAILPATGEALPDPIIYLEGGPGGSALTGLEDWLNTAYGVNRDIILIDQRGTGYSEPGLFCEDDGESDEITVAQTCRDALAAEGIDLGAYTSATNAADIDALRRALGYEQVNLYGVSYGTRLAMTVMRDFPDGIRSVVLDSPFPPSADAFNEDGVNFYYSLTTLAGDCAANAACNAAFPDLEAVFVELVEQANNEPVMIDGEEYAGGDLIEVLYGHFYDTTIIPFLPALIYDFAEGRADAYAAYEDALDTASDDMGTDDFTEDDDFFDDTMLDFEAMSDAEFEAFMMDALGYDDVDEMYDYLDSLSDDEYFDLLDELAGDMGGAGDESDDFDRSDASGMFNSVTCAEETPFSSLETQQRLMAGMPVVLQDHFIDSLIASFETCDVWDVPTSGPIEDAVVVSDIPTLILVGQYDVATPPQWARQAAEGLSRAELLEFPGAGHAIIDATPCAIEIGTAFMDDPTSALDTTCLGRIGPPDFYVP